MAFIIISAKSANRLLIYAVIFAVWICIEVTAFCLHWISFATVEAHATPALVMELIAQAASKIILFRVAFTKPPRKSGVVEIPAQVALERFGSRMRPGSSSAGDNSEKSGGESELH